MHCSVIFHNSFYTLFSATESLPGKTIKLQDRGNNFLCFNYFDVDERRIVLNAAEIMILATLTHKFLF